VLRSLPALGLAVAALLITGPVAVGDPADTTSPSAPETTQTTATTDTTSETTEPSAPESSTAAPSEAPHEEEVAPASVEDFEVNATFDKSSYATGEDMRITATIKNNGPATTVTADAWGQDPDLVQVREWGDLNREIPIAAGATVTVKFVGAVGNPDVTTARLRLGVYDETGATKYFEFTVPVTPTFGHASGTAFDDRDGDNRFDAGEALAGVTLTWQNNLHEGTTFTVTTGADGTFSLPRLPTGPYFVSGTAPDGLLIGYRTITVAESGVDGLLFRAVRPITDLDVDLEFTKDTYGKDETPTVHVTLTNNGDLPLTGIVAYCNRGGGSQVLRGTGDGWGDLAKGGVDIPPHSTLELDVSEPMPTGAYQYGRVIVGCDFGYQGIDQGNPSDSDFANVPGMRGTITGFIGHDETGLAGVRVVLVSEEARCPIVAETSTGADGRFTMEEVPVGEYDLYMYPPAGWRIEHGNPSHTYLVGAGPADHNIPVVRGEAPTPDLPEQPADCGPGSGPTTTTPAPQGSPAPAPGLASTGASIGTPVAVGALALLAGVGALLVTRRRRTS
jgi:hypothetical protein